MKVSPPPFHGGAPLHPRGTLRARFTPAPVADMFGRVVAAAHRRAHLARRTEEEVRA